MSSGYEQIYESLITKLSACDFLEVAERLGLSLQPGGALSVNYLGRGYEISSRGVHPTDGNSCEIPPGMKRGGTVRWPCIPLTLKH